MDIEGMIYYRAFYTISPIYVHVYTPKKRENGKNGQCSIRK